MQLQSGTGFIQLAGLTIIGSAAELHYTLLTRTLLNHIHWKYDHHNYIIARFMTLQTGCIETFVKFVVTITLWRSLISHVSLSTLDLPKYWLHIDYITPLCKQIINNNIGTKEWIHNTLHCHFKLDYQTYRCYQILYLILSMTNKWITSLGLMLLNRRSTMDLYIYICLYMNDNTLYVWR